jgi:hypothetical protein
MDMLVSGTGIVYQVVSYFSSDSKTYVGHLKKIGDRFSKNYTSQHI